MLLLSPEDEGLRRFAKQLEGPGEYYYCPTITQIKGQYKTLHIPDGVMVHSLVLRRMLGYLPYGWHYDHKANNDNRRDQFDLLTKAQHDAKHGRNTRGSYQSRNRRDIGGK